MTLRIADSFTSALTKLANDEQKAVKTAAFDLQMNPAHPGLQMHRVERARDAGFWTARVNRDIRLVLHKQGRSTLLAWVGHHDAAYDWAERRRLDVHPKTGAAQLVEIRERVEEIIVRRVVEEDAPPALSGVDADDLAGYGVPEDWIADALAASEDELLEIAQHLPAEAAEAVLQLATGCIPDTMETSPAADPFEHPQALRRFRILEDREALERALDAPWEQWTVFLHPAQRDFVARDFNGPARVSGSAGTGKTVVALHRAVHLTQAHPEARVLLTTFNAGLANALRLKLARLGSEARIEVQPLRAMAYTLHERLIGPVTIASDEQIASAVRDALSESGSDFPLAFVLDEWRDVVDAWSIRDFTAYAETKRTGRKVRVGVRQRESLWDVMEAVRAGLAAQGLATWNDVFDALRPVVASQTPFDFAVVDEAQDINAAELRFLAALANRDDALFFAGDIGQRIFRPAFSWKVAGIDLRGRARVLRVNYRTSHQIRAKADMLLPETLTDADGTEESRRGLVSAFDGPAPAIAAFSDQRAEIDGVADWLRGRMADGLKAHEIGVFVRSESQIERATAAVDAAGATAFCLSGSIEPAPDKIAIATMHAAKGLEFRAVAVMACDEDVVPLEARLETAGSESDLEEIYATERHLLYVACTRARDDLQISGISPISSFVEDLI